MTTLAQATQQVYDTFIAAWGATSEFSFDNEAFQPVTPGAKFVRVSVRHRVRAQETLGGIGRRKFESIGGVIVQCFSALDKGRKEADDLAQAVRTIFEGKTLTPTAVHFFACDTREIGNSAGRFQVNAEAFFFYVETK